MKCFYSEVDHIITTFNDIQKDANGIVYLRVYHARPSSNCFDYLEMRLLDLNIISTQEFNEGEIKELLQYTRK